MFSFLLVDFLLIVLAIACFLFVALLIAFFLAVLLAVSLLAKLLFSFVRTAFMFAVLLVFIVPPGPVLLALAVWREAHVEALLSHENRHYWGVAELADPACRLYRVSLGERVGVCAFRVS